MTILKEKDFTQRHDTSKLCVRFITPSLTNCRAADREFVEASEGEFQGLDGLVQLRHPCGDLLA